MYCARCCAEKTTATLKSFFGKRLDRIGRFTTKIINEELSGNNRRPYCSRGRGSSFFLYLYAMWFGPQAGLVVRQGAHRAS